MAPVSRRFLLMKLTLKILFVAALCGVALLTGLTIPASAELKTVTVLMADGTLQEVVLDVDRNATLQDVRDLVPGEPIFMKPADRKPEVTLDPKAADPSPDATRAAPLPLEKELAEALADRGVVDSDGSLGETGERSNGAPRRARPERLGFKAPRRNPRVESKTDRNPRPKRESKVRATPMRNSDGSPAHTNPGFVDALPGPPVATGVPNFVIRKFRVPPFLLSIYQAAGIQYGVRWEVLAAINEIETDYGRNLNVSSAGALGWMQFMPSSWKAYGVDANKDGEKDPYNPVDAIFASARYLKAAGYEQDPRRAVFAYNHADWYVDSVMLRARLISGVPADLIGSLTGLTEGRFPIAARARYADDLKEQRGGKKVAIGENAANLVEGDEHRSTVEIFSERGAPVVATNDGVIKRIGHSKRLGRHIVLQDVYGNRYTYAGLGSTAKLVAVASEEADDDRAARALAANGDRDRRPTTAASRGTQPEGEPAADAGPVGKRAGRGQGATDSTPAPAPTAIKQRLFAHPDMEQSRAAGGLEQLVNSKARREGGFSRYSRSYARPVKLDPDRFRLTRLRVGSRVIGGTVLGRIGTPENDKAAHLDFSIRPAGKGAPQIDPKPILDGWKLLEATSVYRASGRNALQSSGTSVGQVLLMPKRTLERRVLADGRIGIYAGGRDDIRSGQADRRVLATMAYLAESGLRPTISSLKTGHGYFTASGNVSAHSSGNAYDISAINGIPIVGNQETGGITEQTVRRLMRLQGTLAPNQIISLLDLGGPTFAMGDHDDHIHVGFQPLYGENRRLGRQAQAVLKPGQWPELLKRLEEIENPVVRTKASPYAIPAEKHRKSGD